MFDNEKHSRNFKYFIRFIRALLVVEILVDFIMNVGRCGRISKNGEKRDWAKVNH